MAKRVMPSEMKSTCKLGSTGYGLESLGQKRTKWRKKKTYVDSCLYSDNNATTRPSTWKNQFFCVICWLISRKDSHSNHSPAPLIGVELLTGCRLGYVHLDVFTCEDNRWNAKAGPTMNMAGGAWPCIPPQLDKFVNATSNWRKAKVGSVGWSY